MNHLAVIETCPVSEEVLTPRQYTALTEVDKQKIKETRVVAPKLGEKGFGGILVRYKTPIYRALTR